MLNRLYIYCAIVFGILCFESHGQSIARSDSSITKVDSLDITPLKDPLKAAMYSTVLPGLGQAYNGRYWEIPIIAGGLFALGSIIQFNHVRYIDSRNGLVYKVDDNPNTKPEDVDPRFVNATAENLSRRMDFYRRNRDLTIIISVLFYGLVVADAAVFAHLHAFDVGDDVSAYVLPQMQSLDLHSGQYATGVKVGLKF